MHCLLNFLLYRGGFRWFHRPRFFSVTIKTIIKSASTEEPSAEHVLWPLSPWPPAFISCSLQSILLRLWLAPGWGIEQGFGSCAACATISLAKLIKASLLFHLRLLTLSASSRFTRLLVLRTRANHDSYQIQDSPTLNESPP